MALLGSPPPGCTLLWGREQQLQRGYFRYILHVIVQEQGQGQGLLFFFSAREVGDPGDPCQSQSALATHHTNT